MLMARGARNRPMRAGLRGGGGQTIRKKTHEHNGRVCPPRGHVVANEEFLHPASVVLRAQVGEGLQRCAHSAWRRKKPQSPMLAPLWQRQVGTNGTPRHLGAIFPPLLSDLD